MSLQPAVTEVKSQHNTVKLYWQGFDAFMNGQALEELETSGERHGWWAACKAEGEAMTAMYLDKAGA